MNATSGVEETGRLKRVSTQQAQTGKGVGGHLVALEVAQVSAYTHRDMCVHSSPPVLLPSVLLCPSEQGVPLGKEV